MEGRLDLSLAADTSAQTLQCRGVSVVQPVDVVWAEAHTRLRTDEYHILEQPPEIGLHSLFSLPEKI